MTQKEFKDTLISLRLNINNQEIQKLADRYINNVGFTIDTNTMIEHMYDKSISHQASDKMKKATESTIISKIAKKLRQK